MTQYTGISETPVLSEDIYSMNRKQFLKYFCAFMHDNASVSVNNWKVSTLASLSNRWLR